MSDDRPKSSEHVVTSEPERWFRALLESAPVMVWSSGPDGECEFFNREWVEFTGRPLAALLGWGWLEDVHPEDEAHVRRIYREAFDRREPFRMEYRLRRHDGVYRWLRDKGEPRLGDDGAFRGYIGACMDIDDQVRHRARVEEEYEKFRAVADYTFDWESWISPDGTLSWVNPAVERLTGYSPAECQEMTGYPLPVVVEADRPLLSPLCCPDPDSPPVNDLEFRILHRDGSARWAAVSWQPIRATNGTFLGYRASVRDIADRKAAEETRLQMVREQAIREALEQDVVALKQERALREQFVSLLTHDLRTPLTAAKAGAQMLLRDSQCSEASLRFATRILSNLDRADTMMRNLLDANLLRAGGRLPLSIQSCELREVVGAALQDLSTIHGDRFVVEAPKDVQGWWDPMALRRVVENLVGNAVKYGAPAAPITVTIRGEDDRVHLSVHNVGEPIPPEEAGRLFEPFRRAVRPSPGDVVGWGVGLTLVRGIAEGHGGAVGVESSLDAGTTFSVELPRDARRYAEAR